MRRSATQPDFLGKLPLHLAIEGATSDQVVLSLLRAAPEAAGVSASDGELPLSAALTHRPSSGALVRALLRAHPAAGPPLLERYLSNASLAAQGAAVGARSAGGSRGGAAARAAHPHEHSASVTAAAFGVFPPPRTSTGGTLR